jgi:tetratricopeptide (TPR) repeat protein
VTLGPLDLADAVTLTRQLLEIERAPAGALARLAERTQGIPRLLAELVRGLKRDGLVRRYERGTGHYLATDELDKLPDLPLIQWNAQREVETLPGPLVGHARLASILGAQFVVGEVEGLIEILEQQESLDDVQLDANVGVQRLIDAGLLVRHRTGLIDFRHSLLRETIYGLLPDDRKQRFHRAAFEMYRRSSEMPAERRLPRLALHAARSGAKDDAARAYLELAERARQTHAYMEAELAFGAALENLTAPGDARGIQAARGRGLMRLRLGRHDDALKDLKDARSRAHTQGSVDDEIEILLDEATALDWMRDFSQSYDLVRAAESLATAPSALAAARIAMGRARAHHRQLDPEACVRVGTEAARMAEALGDVGYETMVTALLLVAPSCADLGRTDEAERVFDKVLAAAQAHGDMHHLAAGINNRVVLWFALKEVDKLFADLAETVRISREVCVPLHECVAVRNMGEVEYVIEALDKATEHAQRALELATQLLGPRSGEACVVELLRARMALYREDRAEARRLLERIKPSASAGGGEADIELTPSDQLLFEMVDLGSRHASAAEWNELLERAARAGLAPLEEVEILEASALSAARGGRIADAETMLRRALNVCAAKPNLMSNRIERRYEAMFGAGGAPPAVSSSTPACGPSTT